MIGGAVPTDGPDISHWPLYPCSVNEVGLASLAVTGPRGAVHPAVKIATKRTRNLTGTDSSRSTVRTAPHLQDDGFNRFEAE
jgi:hypothetical protein